MNKNDNQSKQSRTIPTDVYEWAANGCKKAEEILKASAASSK